MSPRGGLSRVWRSGTLLGQVPGSGGTEPISPNAFAREENQQLANHQPGVFDEPPATELFLTPDDVGAELRVSRGDLKRLRDAVLGPAYFTIGSTIRYLQADVDQ